MSNNKAYAHEKKLTIQLDQLRAERRRQLIVYHFMFDPAWEEGCPGCSFLVDNIGHLAHLYARNTALVLVSRAPLTRIEPFRKRMGWTIPWYSSFGSDFNYDFHGTQDESVAPIEYNYRNKAELEQMGETNFTHHELPGLSVFLCDGDNIFHTYSTYARGTELLVGTYNYLDLTPCARQEDSSDNEWLSHHDNYDAITTVTASCCNSET